jgi:hypothetical protein
LKPLFFNNLIVLKSLGADEQSSKQKCEKSHQNMYTFPVEIRTSDPLFRGGDLVQQIFQDMGKARGKLLIRA